MTLSNFPARRIGGLALAIGGVTLIGIVLIIDWPLHLPYTTGGIANLCVAQAMW